MLLAEIGHRLAFQQMEPKDLHFLLGAEMAPLTLAHPVPFLRQQSVSSKLIPAIPTESQQLYGMENLPSSQAARFEEIKFLNLQTARAWGIKEVFRGFWCCPTLPQARIYFDKWYGWASRSRLKPVIKVARMCKAHLTNILTFFEHRLTNGPIEGLNNKIQNLIKKAYGYRNKQRFVTDIFFHLGGLDLYPTE